MSRKVTGSSTEIVFLLSGTVKKRVLLGRIDGRITAIFAPLVVCACFIIHHTPGNAECRTKAHHTYQSLTKCEQNGTKICNPQSPCVCGSTIAFVVVNCRDNQKYASCVACIFVYEFAEAY